MKKPEIISKINLQKIKQNKTIKELLEFGIINLDKPSGMTSFDVSNFVKKKLKLRKTSHFGTLDPKVTGVLPIALNRACKLTRYFLGEDKEYTGIMRVHKPTSLKKIEQAIKEKFIGVISQLPPVRSRVKRQERKREVKKFDLLEKNNTDIKFHVEVQGGTYIRKLIHDLGQYLGIGAHMIKLRRTRAGIFKEKNSISLENLEKISENEEKLKEVIIPGEIISEIYPVVQIKEESSEKILHGKPIFYEDLEEKISFEKGKIICAFVNKKFIGIYKIANEKNIFAKPEFVLQPLE